MVERNQLRLRKFETRQKIWSEYVLLRDEANNNGDPPPAFPRDPSNGNKEMKRAPSKPTATSTSSNSLEVARLLCMCLNSTCLTEGSDMGSSCPAKCRVRGEGDHRTDTVLATDPSLQRHDWTDSHPRRCSCPICQCTCNRLFRVQDHQSIALALLQRGNRRALVDSNQTHDQQLSNFLGRSMLSGMMAVGDAQAVQQSRNDGENQLSASVRNDTFYTAASETIVRTGGDLSSGAVQLMQTQFQRSTDVTLPGGQGFSTRLVSANDSAHVKNNRIGGVASNANTTAPGMLSNTHINYTRATNEYAAAAANPTNLASTVAHLQDNLIGLSSNVAPPSTTAPPPGLTFAPTSTMANAPSTNNNGTSQLQFLAQANNFGEIVDEEELFWLTCAHSQYEATQNARAHSAQSAQREVITIDCDSINSNSNT